MTARDHVGKGPGRLAMVLILGIGAGTGATAFGQQLKPDDVAAMTLNAGRRALNEKNHDAAAERFREFLKTFGGHKDAPAASATGSASALLEGPQQGLPARRSRRSTASRATTTPPTATGPCIIRGSPIAGSGCQELAKGAGKPANEVEQARNAARPRFEQAAQKFGESVAATKDPADADWAARARCDQAEMFLRLDKVKEAEAAVKPFLSDPGLLNSRYRGLALYDLGFVAFAQKDHSGRHPRPGPAGPLQRPEPRPARPLPPGPKPPPRGRAPRGRRPL